jgi:carbon-monoxide dehydrogenase medium subunit
MTLQPFAYRRPQSLEDALRSWADTPSARLMAGGMSLLPMMKMELAAPPAIIDLGGVEDLAGIDEEDGRIRVGAMTRHARLAAHPLVRRHAAVLAQAASKIGDPQVRNRGTIGGSLAHADPSADLPAAVLALDAAIETMSPRGRRTISADRFFLGPLTTALDPDEMIVAISVPKQESRQHYRKVPHPASGYAVVGVALSVTMAGDRVASAAIGVTGVGAHAYRATQAESMLAKQPLTDAVIAEAAGMVTDGQEVMGDLYASADYRRHLAMVTTRRALGALTSEA